MVADSDNLRRGCQLARDLEEVTRLGQGRIDLTIGSALDVFGGAGVRYEDRGGVQSKAAPAVNP